VIAVLCAAVWWTPTAAAQNLPAPTPDPAPPPETAPLQPTPDPVPAPQPASSAPSDAPAPETQAQPVEPAPAPAPAPAAPEPAPAPAPAPAVQTAANDTPSDRGRAEARRGGDGGKRHAGEKDRSTPVDAANPLPVLPGIGPLVEGLRDRATDAGPPIAVAALALLTLALTSGAFLMVATRRTGAWRT
jgi:outer membrane biosynthesis protein TonB